MNICMHIELLGLLVMEGKTVDPQANPTLFNLLVDSGVAYADELQDRAKLLSRYRSLVNQVEDDLDYYAEMGMNANEPLDRYLKDTAEAAAVNQEDPARQMAVNISCLGNKGGDYGHEDGIERLEEVGEEKLRVLHQVADGSEAMEKGTFQLAVHSLASVLKAMELCDVFLTSRYSLAVGVPEFPDSALTDIDDIPDPDFSTEQLGCMDQDGCPCGCRTDDGMVFIEGLEDLLADRNSDARSYVEGVAFANSLRLTQVAGNEGAVFDAIKDLGKKAYEAAVESIKAIKATFAEGDDEKKLEDADDTATTNKKALQGMKPDTPARINDSARKGIADLAASIDPTGKLKNVVATLNTPADGARVLDALLGFMRRGVTEGSGVEEKIAEAQKNIDALKASTDSADQGDEENADVVKANKTKVQESVAAAKEAMKKLKEELTQHNKWMSGLKKTIAGISPKIFVEDTSKSE